MSLIRRLAVLKAVRMTGCPGNEGFYKQALFLYNPVLVITALDLRSSKQ